MTPPRAPSRSLEGAGDEAAFFAGNPEVSRRYDEDAAFRHGFDALVWAKKQTGPTVYANTVRDLDIRGEIFAQRLQCKA